MKRILIKILAITTERITLTAKSFSVVSRGLEHLNVQAWIDFIANMAVVDFDTL